MLSARDELFSKAKVDFMDATKARGQPIGSVGIFDEDTIFGTDSSAVQGAYLGI